MSKEAITAFLKKVAEDESLQKELVEFAGQHGFDFTSDELSETDLDAVSGGAFGKVKRVLGVPPDDQKPGLSMPPDDIRPVLGMPPDDIKPGLVIPPDDQMPGR
jgi:hypothetical protein